MYSGEAVFHELHVHDGSNDNNTESDTEYRVYKKRWLVLVIFVFTSITNIIQCIEFSIIADVMIEYYQVSYEAVDWTAMISVLIYLVVSVPGTYMIDRLGVRKSLIIAILGTAAGSWVKVGSVHPDRFWLILLGQGIVSSCQVCIYPLLPKLSATWFAYNELSTAVGLGLTGVQIGSAISYIIPPLIVWKGETEDVERRLYILNILYASLVTVMIPFIILFFTDAPPTPPSKARSHALKEKLSNDKKLIDILKILICNKSFIIITLIEGVHFGVLCPLQVLSNQIILFYYPTATYDVGVIGLLMCLLGMIGSMGVSIILDRYKKFKITCWTVYFAFLLSLAFYVGTVDQGLAYVYVTSCLLGIVNGGIATLGVELVMEFTYPEPETVYMGVIANWVQITSIGFTFLYGHIFRTIGILWANLTMLFIVIVVDLLFIFLKFDLRRKAVQDNTNNKDSAHG